MFPHELLLGSSSLLNALVHLLVFETGVLEGFFEASGNLVLLVGKLVLDAEFFVEMGNSLAEELKERPQVIVTFEGFEVFDGVIVELLQVVEKSHVLSVVDYIDLVELLSVSLLQMKQLSVFEVQNLVQVLPQLFRVFDSE